MGEQRRWPPRSSQEEGPGPESERGGTEAPELRGGARREGSGKQPPGALCRCSSVRKVAGVADVAFRESAGLQPPP